MGPAKGSIPQSWPQATEVGTYADINRLRVENLPHYFDSTSIQGIPIDAKLPGDVAQTEIGRTMGCCYLINIDGKGQLGNLVLF
jgi:hypothetical protein